MGNYQERNSGLVDGKTIVVTGCSSGIGAEVSDCLKSEGAKVVGIDLNPSSAVDQFIQADIADGASIESAIGAIPGDCNGLCNIAGLPPTRPAPEVLKVNFIGLRALTTGIAGKLADGASITNLASLAGLGWQENIGQVKALLALRSLEQADAFCDQYDIQAQPGRSYFLSKEALIVWTMQSRWSWRDRGIRMNSVSPGPVETPILQDFVETLGDRVEEDFRVMDRPGTPRDVAPLVAFLQSDGSNWMRGLNIPCDGGMSSHVSLDAFGLAE